MKACKELRIRDRASDVRTADDVSHTCASSRATSFPCSFITQICPVDAKSFFKRTNLCRDSSEVMFVHGTVRLNMVPGCMGVSP